MSVSQAEDKVKLKIYANSTRRALWDAKLGFQRSCVPPSMPLCSLFGDGGPVPAVDVVIMRIYPVLVCITIVNKCGLSVMYSVKFYNCWWYFSWTEALLSFCFVKMCGLWNGVVVTVYWWLGLCTCMWLGLCTCMWLVQYMEKLPDGRTVVRSEATESRVARQHELQRQRRVETLLAKLQQDMEKEASGTVCLFVCLKVLKLPWHREGV